MSPIRRVLGPNLLALVAFVCAALAIPRLASATLYDVDQATDICPSSVDPCVLTQPAEILSGSTLDFGTRGFEVRSSGRLDVNTGIVTVRSGSFTLATSGTAVSLAGPNASGGTGGGTLTVEVRRRCSGNTAVTCLVNSQCAAVGAGTCSVGSGTASLGGKVSGNSDTSASLIVRAAGPIQITQTVSLNGTSIDADGGSIDFQSGDSVTVGALVSADGGAQGAGGEVAVSAAVDLTVTAVIDVSGGDLDGGVLDLSAGRDIVVTNDVNVGATSGGGFGGEIAMDAGRDLRISGGSNTNKVIIANDGHESVDSFGGDGGPHDYSAGRDIYFGQYTRLTSDGAPPDGFGDFLSVSAGGDLLIEGGISARSRGSLGGGGEIDLDAFGQLTVSVSSSIDLTGSQSGGGYCALFPNGNLVFDGAMDVSASNGGEAGDVELQSVDGDISLAGSVKISGSGGRVLHGVSMNGCRLLLSPGANIANSSDDGRNEFVARERMTLEAGGQVTADLAGGSNVITYRTSAKPPTLSGVMTPAPVLRINGTLPGCPVCGNKELDAGESCDDGNRAGGDGCSADCQDEGCVAATPGYPSVALCDDGDPCTQDVCNAQRHACEHVRSCDDGIDCTDDSCDGSRCIHTPVDALCTSGTVCSVGSCNSVTGCVFVPVPGPCNDGLFCNGSDACSNGSCSAHTGNPCSGNPECRDMCDESADRCQSPAGTPCASDGRQCTDDMCNGVGTCIHPDRIGECDDGLFCNGPDVCAAGQCGTHAGTPCTGECRETCNESTRTCGDPQGVACADDGNFCTDDTCDGQGECAHAPYRSFTTLNASVVRSPGADNDRFSFKGAFALDDFTVAPTVAGLKLTVTDDAAAGVFSCDLPATVFADVKGDGSQYRFRDKTGTLAGANGVYLALVRRNPSRGVVMVKVKGRDHEVPGIVNKPEVSVALGFGSDPGAGSCLAGVAVPCSARGSRVSCKR